MVQLSTTFLLVLSAVAVHVHGLPFTKRIAQTISASTQQWEQACDAAGGGQQCNTISVNSFSTLLAAAGPCDQQNAADTMINLAKQLNNNAQMITFAQIFAQQPRNSPTSQAVPYCQSAPNNTELNGLFQCQFQSANEQTFVGGLSAGSSGTIPFGMSSPVSPAGSCPANPSGPIPDGQQLVDITQNPGVGSTGTGAGNNTASGVASGTSSASATVSASASEPSATEDSCDDGEDGAATSSVAITTSAASPSTSASAPTSSSSSSGGFLLQNGQDAQKLNGQFASLTNSSSCNEGDNACVGGGFAQCVGGQYVVEGCASGLSCFALPLVNKQGTSLACTTQSDALSRIQATGAQGGIAGSN
ncbi:hypothetical protein AcV5_005400 [Taiwanofungus camphoratus]|nr:hypothetical protein AcV5_005400 [Antrodia cinnamomea]